MRSVEVEAFGFICFFWYILIRKVDGGNQHVKSRKINAH